MFSKAITVKHIPACTKGNVWLEAKCRGAVSVLSLPTKELEEEDYLAAAQKLQRLYPYLAGELIGFWADKTTARFVLIPSSHTLTEKLPVEQEPMAWAVLRGGEVWSVRRFEPRPTDEAGDATFVPLYARA